MSGKTISLIARVWKEASESVGLGSREKVIVALLIQAFIATGIYLGTSDWRNAEYARVLTAAAPFALFPLLFVWKWITLPYRMSAEAVPQQDRTKKATEVVAAIAHFIRDATDERNVFVGNGDTPYFHQFADAWIQKVQSYLRENVGQAAVLKFMTAPPTAGVVANRSVVGGRVWADLGGKVEALAAIAGDVERR